LHGSTTDRSGVEVADAHGVTAEDCALPSAYILFSTVHPPVASRCCTSNPVARRLPPRIRLYRRNVPATRACCRSPVSFCHACLPVSAILSICWFRCAQGPVARVLGERLRDDVAVIVHADVQLSPATALVRRPVLARTPLAGAIDLQPGRADDQVDRAVVRSAHGGDEHVPVAPGERRVVRGVQVQAH